jgi:hypothetical protein
MAGGNSVVPNVAPVAAANVRKKSRRLVELIRLPFPWSETKRYAHT